MRENGLPKVQSWRWAPCAAFVLGSLSFVTFALVVIPEHIGRVDPGSTTSSLRFGNTLARTQSPSSPQSDWSGDTTNTAAATPSPGVRSLQPSLVTQNDADGGFPKRGFTPPLERPPAAVPPPPPPLPTPAQQQPQLNVPPPVPLPAAPPPPVPAPPPPPPPPAAEPPPAAPPQPELIPQAAPVPAPPASEATPVPPPPAVH